MKLILLVFNLLIASISWCQCKKIEFEIKYSDSSVIKIDTLFLYAVSNTPSRIFIDELCSSLKELLTKKNVFLKYSYEGRQLGTERFNEIIRSNVPSLFIIDEEPSSIRVIGKHSNISGGSLNVPNYNLAFNRTHIAYSNVYSVVMYSGEQKVRLLAEMIIDCKNLSKANAGRKAGNILVNNLNIMNYKVISPL